MKDFEPTQESKECSTEETNQVLQSKQNRFGNAFLQEILSTEITIIGYASPEWNHPKDESPEELNESLAWERADSVEDTLEEVFQSFFDNSPSRIKLNNQGGVITEEKESSAEEMRRVDISTVINSTVFNEEVEQPNESIRPDASCEWAIKIDTSGGHGGAGLAGGVVFAYLKNTKTNQEVYGYFIGAGLGSGLMTPSSTAEDSDESWTNFQTQRLSTFEDFEGTPMQFTSGSVSRAGFGANLSYISFLTMGDKAQHIDVSGFSEGVFGGELVTLVGVWNTLDATLPLKSSQPPSPISDSVLLEERLYFQRGSAELETPEITKLTNFTNQLELK